MYASHVSQSRGTHNDQATHALGLLCRHICGKLVFAAGWDSFGPWPSRRCVDHAVARYRDVYASPRRSHAHGVLQGWSRERTVEDKLACACVCALLHIDTHAGCVCRNRDLHLEGLGEVRMVRVFNRWRSSVGRTLAIGPGRTKLALVHYQHRPDGNGLLTGRDGFRRRRRTRVARIPSRTTDPALRIVEGHYLSGPIVVVLAFALAAGGLQLSRKPCIRSAATVSDPACGGVIRLGVADITHQKLLVRNVSHAKTNDAATSRIGDSSSAPNTGFSG